MSAMRCWTIGMASISASAPAMLSTSRRRRAYAGSADDVTENARLWANRLCAASRYIEVVLAGDTGLHGLSRVIVTRSFHDRHHDLAFQALTGRLQPEEAVQLKDVNIVRELLKNLKLTPEVSE